MMRLRMQGNGQQGRKGIAWHEILERQRWRITRGWGAVLLR